MELPNIKEVGVSFPVMLTCQLANDPTHEKQYKLLQLFAYGTLKDYSDCEPTLGHRTDASP